MPNKKITQKQINKKTSEFHAKYEKRIKDNKHIDENHSKCKTNFH